VLACRSPVRGGRMAGVRAGRQARHGRACSRPAGPSRRTPALPRPVPLAWRLRGRRSRAGGGYAVLFAVCGAASKAGPARRHQRAGAHQRVHTSRQDRRPRILQRVTWARADVPAVCSRRYGFPRCLRLRTEETAGARRPRSRAGSVGRARWGLTTSGSPSRASAVPAAVAGHRYPTTRLRSVRRRRRRTPPGCSARALAPLPPLRQWYHRKSAALSFVAVPDGCIASRRTLSGSPAAGPLRPGCSSSPIGCGTSHGSLTFPRFARRHGPPPAPLCWR